MKEEISINYLILLIDTQQIDDLLINFCLLLFYIWLELIDNETTIAICYDNKLSFLFLSFLNECKTVLKFKTKWKDCNWNKLPSNFSPFSLVLLLLLLVNCKHPTDLSCKIYGSFISVLLVYSILNVMLTHLYIDSIFHRTHFYFPRAIYYANCNPILRSNNFSFFFLCCSEEWEGCCWKCWVAISNGKNNFANLLGGVALLAQDSFMTLFLN